jgi:hypothetical protein
LGRQGVEHVRGRQGKVDLAFRGDVLVQLDAAQRHQILDQPGHAPGLTVHDVQEAIARLGVILGVSAQGVDKAG